MKKKSEVQLAVMMLRVVKMAGTKGVTSLIPFPFFFFFFAGNKRLSEYQRLNRRWRGTRRIKEISHLLKVKGELRNIFREREWED